MKQSVSELAAQKKYRSYDKFRETRGAYVSTPEHKAKAKLCVKNWRKTPEGKAKYKAIKERHRVLRTYGITLEKYEAMLSSQCSVCAICGGVNKDGKKLSIDHDHRTGAVRELLCHGCNLALGNIDDNPERAIALASYLRRHSHEFGSKKTFT